jgi:hypothetical protein
MVVVPAGTAGECRQVSGNKMHREYGKRICDRCGELITAYCPSLETFSRVGELLGSSKEVALEKIIEMEGVDRAILMEYVNHRMHFKCSLKVSYYPFCNGQLRTWRAKQCMHCFKNWRGSHE